MNIYLLSLSLLIVTLQGADKDYQDLIAETLRQKYAIERAADSIMLPVDHPNYEPNRKKIVNIEALSADMSSMQKQLAIVGPQQDENRMCWQKLQSPTTDSLSQPSISIGELVLYCLSKKSAAMQETRILEWSLMGNYNFNEPYLMPVTVSLGDIEARSIKNVTVTCSTEALEVKYLDSKNTLQTYSVSAIELPKQHNGFYNLAFINYCTLFVLRTESTKYFSPKEIVAAEKVKSATRGEVAIRAYHSAFPAEPVKPAIRSKAATLAHEIDSLFTKAKKSTALPDPKSTISSPIKSSYIGCFLIGAASVGTLAGAYLAYGNKEKLKLPTFFSRIPSFSFLTQNLRSWVPNLSKFQNPFGWLKR